MLLTWTCSRVDQMQFARENSVDLHVNKSSLSRAMIAVCLSVQSIDTSATAHARSTAHNASVLIAVPSTNRLAVYRTYYKLLYGSIRLSSTSDILFIYAKATSRIFKEDRQLSP